MKRSPTSRLFVRVDPATLARLTAYSQTEHETLSQCVRRLIHRAFDAHDPHAPFDDHPVDRSLCPVCTLRAEELRHPLTRKGTVS